MAMFPVKTLAGIKAKGLDPTALVKTVARFVTEGGGSLATNRLLVQFPILSGRERVSLINLARRSTRAANRFDSEQVVNPSQVPAMPELFGDDPMGMRTEVEVVVSIGELGQKPGEGTIHFRTFNLAFGDIPTSEDVLTEARRQLAEAQADHPERYLNLNIQGVSQADVDSIFVLRRN